MTPYPIDECRTSTQPSEFRKKPRLYGYFPSKIQGMGGEGETFRVLGLLENISAGGFFLKMSRPVEVGSTVSVTVRLSSQRFFPSAGPMVLMRGVVLRVESGPNHVYGIAAEITYHRFLYSEA